MKLKTTICCGLLGLASAFAEEAKEQSPFDVLHGASYNSVANEAAEDNIDSYLGSPDKFAGKKFFYIEPSAERGVVSFGSFFGGLDISGDIGRATLGYAAPGFGVALKAGVSRSSTDSDDGKSFHTGFGDDLGFNVSKILAGYSITLGLDWLTTREENGKDPEYGEASDERYRDLTVNAALSNSPHADKTVWTFGVEYVNHLEETEVAGEIDPDSANSYMRIMPYLNLGRLGLENARARLFVGVNAKFPITIFADRDAKDADGEDVTLSAFGFNAVLSPNMLGEVAVTKNLMLYGEATYDWNAFGYTSEDAVAGDVTVLESDMNKVTADIGLRYQYENLVACEFAFGDSFFTDTKSIFNGTGVFISFGAFLYF